MERLSRVMDANRLVILAFSVDRSWDPVKRFMADNGFSLPVYADFDRSISSLYGTSKFPETYIVDKQGVVAFKVIGTIDWMAPEMLSFLNQLQAASE
jgi:peroxiredoxin